MATDQKPEQEHQSASATGVADPPMRRRKWGWIVGILIVALAAILYWRHATTTRTVVAARSSAQAMRNRPVPVLVEAVRTGDMHVYIDGLGSVIAANTAIVKTRVDGQLMSYVVTDGQMVRAGDLIAELDPRPFQVLVTQAEGALAKDQAALRNARIDLQRYQTLWAEDSIARQQVDTQAALVRQDEGVIKADEGALASARLNLAYCRITAPIPGRLGLRQVDPGNIVHASDASGIVTITQMQPSYVLFTIPEFQVASVMTPMQAGQVIPIEAYDRNMTRRIASGHLYSMDNLIDPTTGTIRLKAVFTNANALMVPNQFVNVHMLVQTIHHTALAPTAAIQRGSQGAIVFVVQPNHTVSLRRIQTGAAENEMTQVVSGLQPGETVVTDGVDRLHPGARIQITNQQVIPPAVPAQAQRPGKAPANRAGQY